ncbi:XRE family transcriptional regulator [Nocardia sp. CDC153]|uniref:helix-turn-helix domain-containing protein n=1 Tax=Nocardia sp. CDC153 TaxID=3112167 RepID=UPI002DB67335|nr:XRE family transcriptional regulator [Nocardia sp. CDC153]MEC3955173.1 XRE family transcriptional regulator [Nocardia sp. CDC153]
MDIERGRWRRLGRVVHARRLAAGLTLARLAELTGLSQSFLSQFENGRSSSSLRSLQRIADALGVNATELLSEADDAPSSPVVRADEDTRLPQAEAADGSVRSLVHGERDLRALEFTGGSAHGDREFAHANDELIYVVRGAITVVAGGEEHVLGTGDAFYCAAGVRHRWWAHTDDTTTLLLSVADALTIRRRPHHPR